MEKTMANLFLTLMVSPMLSPILALLIFKDDTSKNIVISANCVDAYIDGIHLNNKSFSIYPHIYVSNSSGSSWSSGGGSSSNNNNNNNNNNNR